MRHYPYFKCRFCRTLGVCTVRMLDHSQSYGSDSIVQCRYGTGLSIWKWFVRTLFIVGVIFLICDCIHFNDLGKIHKMCLLAICGGLCLPWVARFVFWVIELHTDFRQKGGRYFWWED